MITTFNVTGMTCGHCARSVTREVAQVDGVEDVAVDLAGGTVTVTGEGGLDTAAIAAAVELAGYRLAG